MHFLQNLYLNQNNFDTFFNQFFSCSQNMQNCLIEF